MPRCNLIEYSDNYSGISGSLWLFKRDEIEGDVDLTVVNNHIPNDSSTFKSTFVNISVVKSLSFNESIICEVSIQNSKGYVGVVCRSPSQNIFESENFLSKFEKVLSDTTFWNSLFTIILGDFNARSSVWWTRDKTTIEGTHTA